MIVAGFGARRHITTAEIVAAYDAALDSCALEGVDALATSAEKAVSTAFRGAAEQLALPLRGVPDIDLVAAAPRALTRSAASLAATGLPSLAEAAALAAAGAGSRLLAPRCVHGPVTCALATDVRE